MSGILTLDLRKWQEQFLSELPRILILMREQL